MGEKGWSNLGSGWRAVPKKRRRRNCEVDSKTGVAAPASALTDVGKRTAGRSSRTRQLELYAGDSIGVGTKQSAQAVVLNVLVVPAVGGLIFEVGDDGKTPIAIPQAEIIAQGVAHRSLAIQSTKTLLNGGYRTAIRSRLELNQHNVPNHLAILEPRIR
jgi:hypothetical protein